MKRNDRFITAPDGTSIAYGVAGQGPALVLTNGLTTDASFWARLWPIWIERYTVVTWDLPGHGESEPVRTPQGASIRAQPRILAGILDALGIAEATHVGFSVGCQIVLEMYRQFPARCSALVALLGTAEHAITSTALWLPAPIVSTLFHQTPDSLFVAGCRGLSQFASLDVGLAVGRKLGLVGTASDRDMREVIDHFGKLDPLTMRTIACSAEAHSAFDVLSRLEVPLLIVAGDKDPFAPVQSIGMPMHRAALASELVRLPEGTHTAMLDHAPEIAASVERFLTRHPVSAQA